MRRIKNRIKIFLLDLLYRRLWTKIAIVLLAVVTIPVVLLGFLLINTSQEALKNSALNSRKEIVTRAAQELRLFIRRPQDILTNTAALFTIIHPKPWEQESMLVELALNEPIFIKILALDLSGKVIASSELGKQSGWTYPEEIIKETIAEKSYISKVKILKNHTPYLTMAVPIKESGKVTGILIGNINLRGIWEIVDNIRLDKTGRAFLVSSDGILIAHSDKKRVLQNEEIKDQNDIQSVLKGETKAMELKDKEGKVWLSAYAPIPDLGWGIVLRQDKIEAYLFSKLMKKQSWLIIIFSELMVILVSIFMAILLSQPIKLMASKFKSVASGDLDNRVEIKRHDEIGELIRSFNYMTKKLKKAKARERLSAIGEASAWIVHEFKNSMVSIKPFVQLFPSKHRDKEFVDTFSKLVPLEIRRWEHMLKELSDFSSHFELNLVKTNVSEIITNISTLMRGEFLEKKINVEYDAQNANFYITADPERLEQVFRNLIINAVNAMPNGGSLIVSTDLINKGISNNSSYIEVRIKDTGIGMSQDSLEKLFEPFHTTKKGGMGLGLTISRKIIEQHGGRINVESQQGIGTTFIVTLPMGISYIQSENL